MTLFKKNSLCFLDQEENPQSDFIFLEPGATIYQTALQRFGQISTYAWHHFSIHQVTLQEALERIKNWPDPFIYVMFLDYEDKRVLQIPKTQVVSFLKEWRYKSEDTYLVSSQLDDAIGFDHHGGIHIAKAKSL